MTWTWLLLVLLAILGIISYLFIVQRVTAITRTPAWLLWIVVMMPAFCMVFWTLLFGSKPGMPPLIGISLFIGCFFLYLYLIQRGKITPDPNATLPGMTRSPGDNSELPVEPLPEAMIPRPINPAEETNLQNCFPWSVFYLQHIEYRPQAVICKGQLRTGAEQAYQTVRANIEAEFGDRFYLVFQEGVNQKPFFALVPNPQAQTPALVSSSVNLRRPRVAIALALLTLITTTWSGWELSQLLGAPKSLPLWQGLPFALALMGFFIIREGGHYWTTLHYKIPATLPYFIPIVPLPQLPIGTVGAFIQLRSPIPHRKALFDVGVVGALMGLIFAILLLGVGLTLSKTVTIPTDFRPSVFKFEAIVPQYSLLLTLLSKIALGGQLTGKMLIKMHPIAVAGWLGLLFTAFNLMPIGQLDGGRMVHAIYGQRTGAIIGQIARLLLLGLSLMQPHLLLWAILLFLLPAVDEPALNDVTELDNRRDTIGLVALGLLLIIILPTPKIVLNALGL
ncbi:MAG: site-2 protease family protein [Synechococcales bacterium]|nr:site-2 protease family protein [Synechococcales bacterium]